MSSSSPSPAISVWRFPLRFGPIPPFRPGEVRILRASPTVAFQPQRLVLYAPDKNVFEVSLFRIAGRNQFTDNTSLPVEVFSPSAIDNYFHFDGAKAGDAFEITLSCFPKAQTQRWRRMLRALIFWKRYPIEIAVLGTPR